MGQRIELMTSSALEPARPRLLDQVRRKIRINHYSRANEKAYVYWIRYFIWHMGKCHPAQMRARAVSDFLSWLATDRTVAAAKQNQSLSALPLQ